MLTRRSTPLACVALLVGLTACGGSSVSTTDLETEISDQLEAQVGRAPDSVDCPDSLPAEVGAEIRCTLTADGETYGLTVTATNVDGSDVLFDIVVDDAPEG